MNSVLLSQDTREHEAPRAAVLLQLLTLATVVFLTALDQTVVVTALLPMGQSLGSLTPHDLPNPSCRSLAVICWDTS